MYLVSRRSKSFPEDLLNALLAAAKVISVQAFTVLTQQC